MNYVAIDLETSGLPETDKHGNRNFSKVCILSIGAWRGQAVFAPRLETASDSGFAHYQPCGKPEIMMALEIVVKPAHGLALDPQAMEKNGLTEAQLAAGMPIGSALEALDLFLAESFCETAVGHNFLAFDLPLLRLAYSERSIRPFFPSRLTNARDTRALWLAWTHGLRRQGWEREDEFQSRALATQTKAQSNLDHVAHTLLGGNARRTGPHKAAADACLAAMVYEAMLERGIVEYVLGKDAI